MVEHMREVHKVDIPKKQGGDRSPPSRTNTQSTNASPAARARMDRTRGRADPRRVGCSSHEEKESEDSEDESSEDSENE